MKTEGINYRQNKMNSSEQHRQATRFGKPMDQWLPNEQRPPPKTSVKKVIMWGVGSGNNKQRAIGQFVLLLALLIAVSQLNYCVVEGMKEMKIVHIPKAVFIKKPVPVYMVKKVPVVKIKPVFIPKPYLVKKVHKVPVVKKVHIIHKVKVPVVKKLLIPVPIKKIKIVKVKVPVLVKSKKHGMF